MTAPLTPPDCDLLDQPRMMIDIGRLRRSKFDSITDDGAWRAGVNLWLTSWHKLPAGSLPNDDAELAKAAGLGRDLRSWGKVRAQALHGWVLCDDGLLYHETVAETVLERWLEKLGARLTSGYGNAKKHKTTFDPTPLYREIAASAAMLARLDSKAKALSKTHVLKALAEVQAGSGSDPEKLPAGAREDTQRARASVPREEKLSETPPSEDNSDASASAQGASPQERALAIELRSLLGKPKVEPVDTPPDPDAQAWSLAVSVLAKQGGLSEKQARAFFGAALKRFGLKGSDLLVALIHAEDAGTLDPQSYITAAAQKLSGQRKSSSQSFRESDYERDQQNLTRAFGATPPTPGHGGRDVRDDDAFRLAAHDR